MTTEELRKSLAEEVEKYGESSTGILTKVLPILTDIIRHVNRYRYTKFSVNIEMVLKAIKESGMEVGIKSGLDDGVNEGFHFNFITWIQNKKNGDYEEIELSSQICWELEKSLDKQSPETILEIAKLFI